MWAPLVPTEDAAEPSANADATDDELNVKDGTATPEAVKTVETVETVETEKTEITKPKSTLKKGCKPHFVPFDEVNYPPAAKISADNIPAAGPSAVITHDSELRIKTEDTSDESSAQTDPGFVTVESNQDNIPENMPTEENIVTFLRQARNEHDNPNKKDAPKIRSNADLKHFDNPSPGREAASPRPNCSTPRPSSNLDWKEAIEKSFGVNQHVRDALASLAKIKFTAINEPSADDDETDEEFATEDGATTTREETEPCADDDATDEEVYADAESGAANPEADTTDQNDNITAGNDKPEQIIPFHVVKDIEKLFQEKGWNEGEEECNTE